MRIHPGKMSERTRQAGGGEVVLRAISKEMTAKAMWANQIPKKEGVMGRRAKGHGQSPRGPLPPPPPNEGGGAGGSIEI